MPVTVICNASTTLGCCQLPRRWAGAGAAPQIGGKLAAEPWRDCALDASAAAAAPRVNPQVTLYLPSGPRRRGPVLLLIRGPAGAPCAPAGPWAHHWAGAHHHGAPRRAHVLPPHAAQRYPGLRAAHCATRSPPRVMLAGGSLRSPPAPPSAAACRPARGVAAGTVCATMQGQAAPMARRRCRPCIVPQPVPYRGPGAQALSGSAPVPVSRPVAGPTLVGPGPPGPVTGLGRAARP